MILKRQSYDAQHRLVTVWAPDVIGATRLFDEDWQADVIELRFKGDPPTVERVLLNRGEGAYLCSDEGRTIEVLSRLAGSARSKPENPKEK